MKRIVVLAAVLLLPLCSFGADAIKLKYTLTLSIDEKGNGLSQPEGVACGEDRLVVADSGNGRLLLYSLVNGEPKGGREIKLSQVVYPLRVKLSPKGDILVLDERQRKIARLSGEGAFKRFVEPTGLPAEGAVIPAGLDVDANDNLYLLDVAGGRVLVLDADGKFQRQIAFPADYGFITDLAVDARGTVYAIDGVASMVYSTAKDPAALSPIAGPMKDQMKFPMSIAPDNQGTLFVADQNGGGIVLLGQDGSFRGRQLDFGWKDGFLRYPAEICLDKAGDLFIADRENSRVQEFSPLR